MAVRALMSFSQLLNPRPSSSNTEVLDLSPFASARATI
jgi:hypothetical protein